MIRKPITDNLTSYDALKTFAVLIMVVDHIGHYFFPDILWLRVIGRLCVPAWFFLIGYARSRDLPRELWIGALVLTAADVVVGMPLFPVNILVTIIIIRLVLDKAITLFEKNKASQIAFAFVLFMVILPTSLITDYGTSGLIMAMFGYYVRHKKSEQFTLGMLVFCWLSYILSQQLSSGFDVNQFTVVAGGTLAAYYVLKYFRPMDMPSLRRAITPVGVFIMQACGRYSLEIYVAHLLIFKLIAISMGFEGFGLFQVQLLPPELFE